MICSLFYICPGCSKAYYLKQLICRACGFVDRRS